ncbi:class I SAM-dependent methyltransferase [Pendulispora albinea]|uniref:Class I SAM-dependent methyltransferase n=1 Tax=Pendulispora albinea TaxID=2741071 RepID=A0ABZ2LL40_9BACT
MVDSLPLDARDRRGSPDRFGYEWATYSTILPESKHQLERWLGSTGLASFRGKRVMDVGCGMGRNPYWYLDAGATSVTAVDVDDQSLEAARKNLASFAHARVEKCSAYDLEPSRFGRFERVTCIGVLHHLDDPETALQRMWSCVEPGGDLVLWCYAKEGNRLFLPVIQAVRALASRTPIRVNHLLAKGIAAAAWPALRLAPWRTDYYRKLRTLSFGNVESIIFDQMLPHIAHYWTRADMQRLAAGIPDGSATIEFVQGNSWHVRITRSKASEGAAR